MNEGVRAVLERHRGPGVAGGGPVWRIHGSSEAIRRCKIEVLEAICREAHAYVRYEDPPTDHPELAAAAETPVNRPLDAPSHGLGTWLLPLAAPGQALLEWLYLGNWQLYVRHEPLAEIPDLCRANDERIASFVAENGLEVIIDSFHDDEFWAMGLGK